MDYIKRSAQNAAKTRYTRLINSKWFTSVLAQNDLELLYNFDKQLITFSFCNGNTIKYDINQSATYANDQLIYHRDSIRNHFKSLLLPDEDLCDLKDIIVNRKTIVRQFMRHLSENESVKVSFDTKGENHDVTLQFGDDIYDIDKKLNIFVDHTNATFIIDGAPVEREFLLERLLLRVSLFDKYMNR